MIVQSESTIAQSFYKLDLNSESKMHHKSTDL